MGECLSKFATELAARSDKSAAATSNASPEENKTNNVSHGATSNKKKDSAQVKSVTAPTSSPGLRGTGEKKGGVPIEYQSADPKRWQLVECKFAGSAAFESIGKQETVKKPIDEGIQHFKANPGRYIAMTYQSSMEDWPKDQQQYCYIHRIDTVNYKPQGVSPSGWMTVLMWEYQALPPMKDNVLPAKFKDKYTDAMTHNRRKLHSAKNKPALPGRGMGVCDTPLIKIIGDVDPSDIHQGSVGDCWLLSAISALAEFDGAIKRLYRKTKNLDKRPLDGPNQYIVTLWDLPTWAEVDIVIDERLPVLADGSGRLLASKPSEDGELWVVYLEKVNQFVQGDLSLSCRDQFFQSFGFYLLVKRHWQYIVADGTRSPEGNVPMDGR